MTKKKKGKKKKVKDKWSFNSFRPPTEWHREKKKSVKKKKRKKK